MKLSREFVSHHLKANFCNRRFCQDASYLTRSLANVLLDCARDRSLDGRGRILQTLGTACPSCNRKEPFNDARNLLLQLRGAEREFRVLQPLLEQAVADARLPCVSCDAALPALNEAAFQASKTQRRLEAVSSTLEQQRVVGVFNLDINWVCRDKATRSQLLRVLVDAVKRYLLPGEHNTGSRRREPVPYVSVLTESPQLIVARVCREHAYQRVLGLDSGDRSIDALLAHDFLMDCRVLSHFGLNVFVSGLNTPQGDKAFSLSIVRSSGVVAGLKALAKPDSAREFERRVRLLKSAAEISSSSAFSHTYLKLNALDWLLRESGKSSGEVLQSVKSVPDSERCLGEHFLLKLLDV